MSKAIERESDALPQTSAGWGEMVCDWCKRGIEENESPVRTDNEKGAMIWICETCIDKLAATLV
ncbi:MAG: hypothetical protein M3348_13305 [Acidobacteriota bacterium]|nr:hypothetical protein [Acidobacteriota bacterium]